MVHMGWLLWKSSNKYLFTYNWWSTFCSHYLSNEDINWNINIVDLSCFNVLIPNKQTFIVVVKAPLKICKFFSTGAVAVASAAAPAAAAAAAAFGYTWEIYKSSTTKEVAGPSKNKT